MNLTTPPPVEKLDPEYTTVFKRGEMEVDVRAFDTLGKQVYSDIEYG